MIRTRWLAATTAALLVAALTTAQETEKRGRYAGWVQDTDGKRVANADVILLSRPLPGRPDLGKGDELHARTGADGMFRTTLLHGRAYSAWATWRDKHNKQQRSQVLEDVFPGPPRAIEVAPQQTLRTIRITGSKAWLAQAPLSLTALTASANVAVVPLSFDDQFVCKLPTLPGERCDLELRGKNGLILSMLMSARLSAEGTTEQTLKLSAPKTLRIVIVDDLGAPVTNALVRHAFGYHSRDLMTELGRTDKQGVLNATVPADNPMYVGDNSMLCCFQITAPGRQRVLSWTKLDKVEDTLQLTLPVGVDLVGKILAKDGTRATGITLLPDCYAMGADNASTGTGVPPRPSLLDADGRFHFSSLHPKYDFRLLALLDPNRARAQGMKLREGIAVAPVVWLTVGAPAYGTPHQLDDIRLDAIPVAQIRVTTHAGVPVPGARLMATTQDLYNSPMHYVCDRVGRLQFPLPNDFIRIGAWVPGGGVATLLIKPPRDTDDPSIDPLIIKLSATYTVHGVIVDSTGKPIPDATVHQWNRAKIGDRPLAEVTFKNRAKSAPTDAEGKFSLTLPLADAAFAIRAFGRLGGVMHNSEEVMITPDGYNNDRLRIEMAPHNK